MTFWSGFEKQAAGLGQISGLGHFGSRSAGRVVGARPSTLMTTASAFKPNPIPATSMIPARHALSPKAPTGATSMTKQVAHGVSSTVI